MPLPIDSPVGLDDVPGLIRARWSPYRFAATPIPDDTLRRLFDAARWAPSSRNEQPWRFVLGERGEGEAHARILRTLNERNQTWARHAPVLGLACTLGTFARTGTPNASARYDTGAAMATLSLAAAAYGLAVHQMAGFDATAAHEAFRLPEDASAVVAFALGVPAGDEDAPDGLPDDIAQRDETRRDRRCLADLVFTGSWDAPRWPDALDGCPEEGA
ncbi:MAG: nitroreductase family protein [Rubricoccaceae bacterium]|nr:nitroreductase family protein [Rubricoccaceae bacterium]